MSLRSPARPYLKSARKASNEGKFQEALRNLVSGFRADVTHKPLYTLAAGCLREIGGDEEAQMFDAALTDFRSIDPFLALGYHFIDVERYASAIPFLDRAHALAPLRIDVARELAQTYTSRFRSRLGSKRVRT